MKKIKSEKGSITLFVLVGLLFMSSFLVISLTTNVNKAKMLKEQYNIVQKIYKPNSDEDEVYNDTYSKLREENKELKTVTVENENIIELTNTFEEEVKGLKIYGSGTVSYAPQYNLPSEYQEVEYIENDGYSYIDTGYIQKTKPKVEFEAMLLTGNDRDIMGNKIAQTGCFIADFADSTFWYRYSTTGNTGTYKCSNSLIQKWIKYEFSDKVYIDNEKITSVNTWDFSSNTQSICLFRGRTISNLRIKVAKIYDNDILVRKMVPCYRISDGEVGMYDTVEGKFYTNAGNRKLSTIKIETIGDIVNNIEDMNYGKYAIPIKITNSNDESVTYNIYLDRPLQEDEYIDYENKQVVRNNGKKENIEIPQIDLPEDNCKIEISTKTKPSKIEVRYTKYTIPETRLPLEYQKVEYIESTGTQYIDSKVIGESGLEFEGKIFIPSAQNGDHSVVGSRKSGSRLYALNLCGSVFELGYGSNCYSGQKLISNEKIIFYSKLFDGEQILKINNDIKYQKNSQGTISTNLNEYIFALNSDGNATWYASFQLYYLKIYKERVLLRNLIPCYRKSDNEVGMYDLVEGKFYTNSGTGEFIAGPEV